MLGFNVAVNPLGRASSAYILGFSGVFERGSSADGPSSKSIAMTSPHGQPARP